MLSKIPKTIAGIPTWIVAVFLIVSFFGFLDASYLAFEHFTGRIPPCTIGGCDVVTTSSYSVIGGVPVALMGAIYYLFMFLGTVFFIDKKSIRTMRILAVITPLGFLSALYFFSIQAFVLHAYCPYCLFSAVTSTILFIVGTITIYKIRDLRVN